MEPSIAELGTGLGIVIVAVLCGGLILLGGIVLVIVRSGILGTLLSGLGGIVAPDDGGDVSVSAGHARRRGRAARARAAEIRARYEREFDPQAADLTVRPAGTTPVRPVTPPGEPALPEADGWIEPAPRRRSARDDYDDELDAYLEESEL